VIVRKLEKAYKEVYGAKPLNWCCFMNNAFRTEPFNPHVSWQIYPRYKTGPVVDGITFDDPHFGEFFDDDAKKTVSDEVVEHIASKLRDYLAV
jgi:diadenosine tetraphosphate (Ap4A) HIT family hydrolase